MNILSMPRRAGKTQTMIALCAAQGGYIICRNRREAARIFSQAESMGLKINMPITFSEFANKQYYGKGIRKFMIDDVDELLHFLSDGVEISFCTYTPR
jgi:hypothetical protein